MTERKRDLYDYIGTLAMITTPIAAAVFFGWHAWSETLQLTGDVWLSRLAAIATAVTLEAVGMYAGHMAISLYPQRRWLYGFAALVLYTAVGVVALWGTVGMFAFLLAPVVYGLVALRHDARAVQTEQRETAHDDKAWERQQIVEDKKRAHELKLARIEAKTTPRTVTRTVGTHNGTDTGHMAQFPSDWRLLSAQDKRTLAGMTPEEIADAAGIHPKSARRWKGNLSENGWHK